ncbi:MAG: 50S ribosomal protein L11 methyltransferase [Myxococcales bacterium]
MSFLLVLAAPPEELEILAAELFDLGAAGVELQEPGQLLMPGTPALPEGLGRCIGYFTSREDALSAAGELGRVEAVPVEVPEQDWSVAWRAHHKPLRIGPRVWVHPPWDVPSGDAGLVRVAIDPGMAFGTGSHPTTALCLERLDELLLQRPGADVLDVGTGSGILAIGAVLLGAARVCGTENDPIALEAARRGAELNGLPPGRIEYVLAEAPRGTFDIVVANILLNTLVELSPAVASCVAPSGRLVLSGLLAEQGDEAEAAYRARGLLVVGRKQREEWIRVELERPA